MAQTIDGITSLDIEKDFVKIFLDADELDELL